ncbi:Bro-N domain-containing protein [Haemophilus parainfluenzae]|uniref:Bro-N domain-containing protein n=1 Tax=Haemophilus parainfluenzae TaxID=729 RepID=A0A7M1NVV5_HAEPA|nr:Bro-N domain-containing protein [Haemophilus parainfluenzae]QOR16860.1 Bro-N domain-containing protein [Haemophilus parainfluenzae]
MSNQSQLSTFNFESNSIRTLAINNEPWFIAKDVCDTLKISNVSDALLKLDDDEKATIGLTDSQAGNGAQSISIISESGMYTLILRCRDAVKKGSVPHRFRKWVTSEVLPQIRKTGSYSKTTVDQRTGLRNAVNMLVSKKGLIYSDAYHLIHQRFNVESIEDLTLEQLPQAVEYIHKIVLEGELIIEEKKEPSMSLNLTERELKDLINTWMAFTRFSDSVGFLLRKIQPIIHGNLYSSPEFNLRWCNKVIHDTQPIIKKLLERLPQTQLLHNSRAQVKQRCEM